MFSSAAGIPAFEAVDGFIDRQLEHRVSAKVRQEEAEFGEKIGSGDSKPKRFVGDGLVDRRK